MLKNISVRIISGLENELNWITRIRMMISMLAIRAQLRNAWSSACASCSPVMLMPTVGGTWKSFILF